jgi:hypothetical protein
MHKLGTLCKDTFATFMTKKSKHQRQQRQREYFLLHHSEDLRQMGNPINTVIL